MKNVSKIALAVFAAVGLAACGSNNGSSVEHFANYSKTDQGKKDAALLNANNTAFDNTVEKATAKAKNNGELVAGSKQDTNTYARFGVFRAEKTAKDEIGSLRYSVVSTEANKLDAAKALAALTAKNEKGNDYKEKIEATYTGKLAYSDKERNEDNHLAVNKVDLTLNLKNDRIGGEANDATNHRHFTFEATNIYNNGGELAYSGKLEVVTGDKVVDAEREYGTYHGFFGGKESAKYDKAEIEKAGADSVLSETAGKIDTPSFKGAFDGKKQN